MKLYHSVLLCGGYAVYLVLGAVIFMYVEYEENYTYEVNEPPEWTRLKELALMEELPADKDEVLSLARWLPRACTTVPAESLAALTAKGSQETAVWEVEAECPFLHQKTEHVERMYTWTFIEALHFSMTVITTIGYGVLSPLTVSGRILCILYSLVGIPFTGILLAWSSESFGNILYKLFKSKIDKSKQHSRLMIGMVTLVYIFLGFVVFIFLPSAVFMVLENWTYVDSVYFSYITLTTIGFGDLVAGLQETGVSSYVYHIGINLWIMVGLGYWVMVVGFITKALKSKYLQASIMRSSEEVKKLMKQMGIKNVQDPAFLTQHSKGTMNLMLQLSSIIAMQGEVQENEGEVGEVDLESPKVSSPTTTATTGLSSPSSPPISHVGIPGISSLFGSGFSRTTPFSGLMGPMQKEDDEVLRRSEGYKTVTIIYKL